MRGLIFLALVAGAAEAHPLSLRAGNSDCGALEALVLLGQLGPADDLDVIEAALGADDRAACAGLLAQMGRTGLHDPDCARVFDLVATFGLPDNAPAQEAEAILAVLAPDGPEVCARLLDMLAQQP